MTQRAEPIVTPTEYAPTLQDIGSFVVHLQA
jgi:hypothetical protein